MNDDKCSAAVQHVRYLKWVTTCSQAVRIDSQRQQARRNRRRRKLSARRRDYWGRIQRKMERKLMRMFHAIPGITSR